MTLYLNTEDRPTLLVPTRFVVFAKQLTTVRDRSRKATRTLCPITFKTREVAWQGWNADPAMETRMTRLQGAGSFYWPNALRAYLTARNMVRADSRIHQVKIETISGHEIGRIYAGGN